MLNAEISKIGKYISAVKDVHSGEDAHNTHNRVLSADMDARVMLKTCMQENLSRVEDCADSPSPLDIASKVLETVAEVAEMYIEFLLRDDS